MHCRHHTHHEHYKSNSRLANMWTYYQKSTKFACKIVPVMTPRSRAPPASNVNKGIPGLLGLPLHVVDCYVNTGRRRQVTMPALIKSPVCIRHHGGNTRGCTSSSIGKVWPYLNFKGKTKEGVRPHFGPLFWQDLWCDCFTTTWLWKKSGVFLTTPCSEKEEGPRDRMCIGDMSSQLDPIRTAQKSRSTWRTSLQSLPRLSS